jgi:hypothetical protein
MKVVSDFYSVHSKTVDGGDIPVSLIQLQFTSHDAITTLKSHS